jgi:hypothetical protein
MEQELAKGQANLVESLAAIQENCAALNANGKRELGSDDEAMPDESTTIAASAETSGVVMTAEEREERKQRYKEQRKLKLKRLKAMPKVKTLREVVYRNEVSSIQVLNETYPGLVYTFDYDAPRKKFACGVEVRVASPGLVDQVHQFVGLGASKKDARRVCAHRALIALYPFTYKPPQNVLDSLDDTNKIESAEGAGDKESITVDEEKKPVAPEVEISKRLVKLCSKPGVAMKTATQLLYECCKAVAETATCVKEDGPLNSEQRFAYKITNVLMAVGGENSDEQAGRVVYGYGKKKQDAKNAACKEALRVFFNFDMDMILASAAAYAAMQNGGLVADQIGLSNAQKEVNQPMGVPPPPALSSIGGQLCA